MIVHSSGPIDRVSPTAIGAKSIFTTMKNFNLLTAIITGVNILTKGFSAALSNSVCSFILNSSKRMVRVLDVLVPILIKKWLKKISFQKTLYQHEVRQNTLAFFV